MSLAELLPAIQSLPCSERVQLLHLLIDGVAETPPPGDGIPERLRPFVPPEGAVIPFHSPVTTDAAGMQLLESLLPATDLQSPIFAPEAAAALAALLAQGAAS